MVERVVDHRPQMLRAAQRLALFTISWNLVEGTVAITAAWVAGSRALIGFGLDSAVESISASVLLWRLTVERRDAQRAQHVETQAARLIGLSFLVLAAVVGVESVRMLVLGETPDGSPVGIALTGLSLLVMPMLAYRKRRVAIALGSRAAVADSSQTWACAVLSAVVLIGLVLNAAAGWWWADPIAALVVVGLLVREGHETLQSESVDDCC